MAIEVGTLEAILKLRDELSPMINKAAQNVERDTKKMGGAFDGLIKQAAGLLTVGAAIYGINKALTEFSESEQAVTNLNRALVNSGIYTDNVTRSLQAQAKALMDVTTQDDEAIMKAQEMFATFGAGPAEIEKATKAATEMAAVMGTDMPTAASALIKAAQGSGREMKVLGIDVKDAEGKLRGLSGVSDEVQRKLGGAALDATKTYAGAMAQMKVQIGEAWEAMGKLLNQMANAGSGAGAGVGFFKWLSTFFGETLVKALGWARAGFLQFMAGLADASARMHELLAKVTFGEVAKGNIEAAKAERLQAAAAREAADAIYNEAQAAAALTAATSTQTPAQIALAAAAVKAAEALEKAASAKAKVKAAAEKLAKEVKEQLSKELDRLGDTLTADSAATEKLAQDIDDANFDRLGEALTAASAAAEQLGIATDDADLDRLGEELTRASKATEDATAKMKDYKGTLETLGEISEVFGSIREGLVAMGVDADSALMRVVVGIQTCATAAEGFVKALASGNIAGMISSGIGALVGIFSAIGIGGDKAIMKLNDVRDAFLESYGGWEALAKSLRQFTDEDIVAQIFAAKTVEEYDRAVKKVKKTFADWEAGIDALDKAMETYGITIDQLGPKFKGMKFDEIAAGLLESWDVLNAAGVDYLVLCEKMGPAISDYVDRAVAAGVTIPESMRPAIDKLWETGRLVHANGVAFTEAEYKALKYGTTLTEAMMQAVDAILDLVAALTGIPRDVTTTVTTEHRDTYPRNDNAPEIPPGVPGAQFGRTWTDYGPGKLAVLHGVERVQTPAQAAAEGGLSQSGLESALSRNTDRQTRKLKRAFRDAVLKAV